LATFFLDTHAVYWLAVDPVSLSLTARQAIGTDGAELCMSAVTAFEYADLVQRERLPLAPGLGELLDGFAMQLIDYPAAAARLAPLLPFIHLDPVDRMLVAHAIAADVTLITADSDMHKYPAKTLW
jgi:PIN domain nuclease of toxin-antitoxin system